MEQTIINFIREIGVDNAIRLLWVIVVVIIAVSVLLALRIVWLYAKRGNPAQDTLTRAFERQQEQVGELQEDITENTKERWKLLGQLFEQEQQLKNCQELLARTGIGGLSASEEKSLREMIIRQREQIQRLQEELEIQKGDT